MIFRATPHARFLAFVLERAENTSGTAIFLLSCGLNYCFTLAASPKVNRKEGEREKDNFPSWKASSSLFVASCLAEASFASLESLISAPTVSCYSCQLSRIPQLWGSEGCPTFSFEVPYKLLSTNALLSCIYEELETTM